MFIISSLLAGFAQLVTGRYHRSCCQNAGWPMYHRRGVFFFENAEEADFVHTFDSVRCLF